VGIGRVYEINLGIEFNGHRIYGADEFGIILYAMLPAKSSIDSVVIDESKEYGCTLFIIKKGT